MFNVLPFIPQITQSILDSTHQGQLEPVNTSAIGTEDWLRFEASKGNESALDYLINYRLSQDSVNDARAWTERREDTQYQRMIADLKKAGINPYFALTGGNPVSSVSSGISYSGSNYTSSANNVRTTKTSSENNKRTNEYRLIGNLLSFLGGIFNSATNLVD